MKLAVEAFGKGIDVDLSLGWGFLSLKVGRHLDMLLCDDGTRGRRWFDWTGTVHGSFEVWLGRRHLAVDVGPALAWIAPKPGRERAIAGWPDSATPAP